MIVFDTETEPFAPGYQLPKVIATVWGRGSSNPTIDTGSPSWWGTDCGPLVGFEVCYDVLCLAGTYGGLDWALAKAERGEIIDLRLRWLLWEYAKHGRRVSHGGYGLDDAAKAWYLEPHTCKDSPWRTRYAELATVPVDDWPAEALTYIREDYRITHALAEAIAPQTDERAQTRYTLALRLMGAWGLRVDGAAVTRLASATGTRLAALESALEASGIVESGTLRKAPVQARVEAVCGAHGLAVPKTPTGAVATGAKDLRDLAVYDSTLETLAEYTRARSILTREVRLLGPRKVVHSYFDLAVSGRTTSRPNFQNFARGSGIRQCFEPRPGHVFVCVDYPALELRTLAQACIDWIGRSELAEVFRVGRDPHTEFAERWLGGIDNRQLAKAANFGFPGGMAGESFRQFAWQSYGVRVDDPKALETAWFRANPSVRALMGRARAKRARIEHIRSGRIRGRCSATQASNTLFQGLGADVAKATLWRLVAESYGSDGVLRGCRPVLFVHDEFLIEAPESTAERMANMVDAIIRAVWTEWIPDVPLPELEFKIGHRWEK